MSGFFVHPSFSMKSYAIRTRGASLRPTRSRFHAHPGVSPPSPHPLVATRATGETDVPPGCSRYIARISKPIGLVLEETSEGLLRVGEIKAGGNAERWNDSAVPANRIAENDQLIAVSGFTRTGAAQVYGETEVTGGEKMVRIVVGAQDKQKRFDVVVSAISSHLAGMDVELEFQRCE